MLPGGGAYISIFPRLQSDRYPGARTYVEGRPYSVELLCGEVIVFYETENGRGCDD